MPERPSGGERLVFGEGTIVLHTPGEETGGAFSVFEEVPPMLDTPLHTHAHEDELFYIVEGDHVCQRGDEEFNLGPGDTMFLPRGVPHAHRRVVPKAGRLLVVVSPAGFEGFFRMLAQAEAEGRLGPEAYAEASERYGITWLT
jgi:mannose-6-phosphate isomerase-like protein (cupin superfamily)